MSRGTIELIGGSFYVVALAALAFISGAIPLLNFSQGQLADVTVRLIVVAAIGLILFVIALRQEGRKWKHVIVVPLVLTAVVASSIFVPLWLFMQYIHAAEVVR